MFVFTLPHLFVSLALFSQCVCVALSCLHVDVILVLMKEFSASLLRLCLRLGLGWGEGGKDEGEDW